MKKLGKENSLIWIEKCVKYSLIGKVLGYHRELFYWWKKYKWKFIKTTASGKENSLIWIEKCVTIY